MTTSLPEQASEQDRQNRRKNQLDRRKVDKESVKQIHKTIKQVDDPEATAALQELAHIVTGDDRFEGG